MRTVHGGGRDVIATAFVRRTLGPKFSEGARLLWLAVVRQRLTLRQVSEAGGAQQAHYWLFGDKRPGPTPRRRLRDGFGIEPALWDEAPHEPFSLDRLAEQRDAAGVAPTDTPE